MSVRARTPCDSSLRAFASLYPPGRVVRLQGAVCLRMPEAPDTPMLNRIVVSGADGPPTEATLDAAIEVMEDVAHYVAVEPAVDSDELEQLLVARGYAPGWGWMRFERGAEPTASVRSSLKVCRVDVEEAAAFARIQREAYGLPDAMDGILRCVPSLDGWTCWLAKDGSCAVAAAALFADGTTAYLGFGATLAAHRGKGGQGALFAARIEHARSAGCTRIVTETGERRDDLPSTSYRNIVRFGFEERDVLRNWVRER